LYDSKDEIFICQGKHIRLPKRSLFAAQSSPHGVVRSGKGRRGLRQEYQMKKSKWRNILEIGKRSSGREFIFLLLTVPAFVEKAVVPERSLLEKWGTHRG
jgi:hypothetical protein